MYTIIYYYTSVEKFTRSHTHTHSHTFILTHTHSHSLTHSHTFTFTHTLAHSYITTIARSSLVVGNHLRGHGQERVVLEWRTRTIFSRNITIYNATIRYNGRIRFFLLKYHVTMVHTHHAICTKHNMYGVFRLVTCIYISCLLLYQSRIWSSNAG